MHSQDKIISEIICKLKGMQYDGTYFERKMFCQFNTECHNKKNDGTLQTSCSDCLRANTEHGALTTNCNT
jgi:hypothetical protein